MRSGISFMKPQSILDLKAPRRKTCGWLFARKWGPDDPPRLEHLAYTSSEFAESDCV